MKLTIERTAVLRSLSHVQSVVERRNTIPILSNVLLKAEADRLTLTATDMDMEIVEHVPATIATPGGTTVPAHMLYDIVRKLPEGSQIEFDGDGSTLFVSAGRSRFKLSCLPVEDFPEMVGGDLPTHFALGASDLRSMIDRTRFAVSQEETRYYLNGIFLHGALSGDVGVLRAVATDGHRLARVEMPLPEGAADMPNVIIPRKAVLEVRKLIDDTGDNVDISLSDTKVRFSFNDSVLVSKLIDGTFPDYERVIPKANDKVLEVDPKIFAGAVDRVATVSAEKSRAVKLDIKPGGLTVSAQSAEAGSATEEIEVRYDQDPLEIGFNSKYLLDIAAQIDGEGCRLTMADSASPTIISDAADASAVYVLMPMRV
mgnify:CR=1 FL=1